MNTHLLGVVFPLEAAGLNGEMHTMMSTTPPIIVVTTIVTTQEGIVVKSFIDREHENQLGGRWDQKLFPILQDNREKMGKKQRENWFEIEGGERSCQTAHAAGAVVSLGSFPPYPSHSWHLNPFF